MMIPFRISPAVLIPIFALVVCSSVNANSFSKGPVRSCEVIGGPGDLTIDSQGNTFVTNYAPDGGAVTKISPQGKVLLSWDVPSLRHGGIATDMNGTLYLANGAFGKEAILRFSSTGTFLSSLDFHEVGNPEDVTVDRDGNIYVLVSRYGDNHDINCVWGIQILSASGQRLYDFCLGYDQGMHRAREGRRIAFDVTRGLLYVAESGQYVHQYALDGTHLATWGAPGEDVFGFVKGMAVDQTGVLYFARKGAAGTDRIQAHSSDGELLAQWDVEGVLSDLTLDRNGLVYARTESEILVLEVDRETLGLPAQVINDRFRLEYANPITSRNTTFRLSVGRKSHVTLGVYDVQGRLVKSLADAKFPAGDTSVSWDSSDERGERVSAGVYFIRAKFASQLESRKIVVLR